MDFANAHNVGESKALTQTTSEAGYANWRQQDYAWTHSARVEGLFVVLTIVIVPVAILRWGRRVRSLSFVVADRRRRDTNS
jgi:hypothetical protein